MSWPVSWSSFNCACRDGLATVRPLRPVAREHDPGGWNYGAGWPPSLAAYGRLRALLTLAECQRLAPRRALEVAAGDAALSACLAADGCHCVANDLRAEHLQTALADFANGAEIGLAPGSAFDLDAAQLGRFDLITACEVLEHVAHPATLLAHLRGLLMPGGRLLVTTPNGAYFHNRLPTYSQVSDRRVLEARQFQPDADGHLFLITPDELEPMAAEAGLRVERLVLWGLPPLTGHLGGRRLAHRIWSGAAFQLERWMQYWPRGLRERLTFNLLAILAPFE